MSTEQTAAAMTPSFAPHPLTRAAVLGLFLLLLASVWHFSAWQVHDDAGYAMVAQGYGFAPEPMAGLFVVHPLIGMAASGIAAHTGLPGYALVVYLLSLLALSSMAAAMSRCGVSGLPAWACIALASAPLLATPQYTMTAGYLAVAGVAAAAMATTGTRPRLVGIWLVLAFACWTGSALLRLQMLILGVAICLPWIGHWLISARRAERTSRADAGRPRLASVTLAAGASLLAAGLAVALTTEAMQGMEFAHMRRMVELVTPFVDYGRQSLLMYPAMAGKSGFDEVEIGLMGQWFFADPNLFTPERLALADAAIPIAMEVRWGVTSILRYLPQLPDLGFFWFSLALIPLAWLSAPRWPIALALAAVVLGNLSLALLGRPFPDRVGLGITAGLLGLAVMHGARMPASIGRGARTACWATTALLVAAGASTMRFAFDLPGPDALAAVKRDLQSRAGQLVYMAPGSLPLRAIVRPSEIPDWPMPRLVTLSSGYFHPMSRANESVSTCGAFMPCLLGGGKVSVYARDGFVDTLRIYLDVRYGRRLEVTARSDLGRWTHFELTSMPVEGFTGLPWAPEASAPSPTSRP